MKSQEAGNTIAAQKVAAQNMIIVPDKNKILSVATSGDKSRFKSNPNSHTRAKNLSHEAGSSLETMTKSELLTKNLAELANKIKQPALAVNSAVLSIQLAQKTSSLNAPV